MTTKQIPMSAQDSLRMFEAYEEEDEKFKYLLGEFMMVWSDTEAELYKVLKHYSEISDSVARAIFSGTRAKSMIDYLRTIIHNKKITAIRKSDLEFVFSQITAINTIRDRIVHFSSENSSQWKEPETRLITNHGRVSRYGKHFVEEVGSTILQNIINDLWLIQNHLNQHWRPRKRGDVFRAWRENFGEPSTWFYKPSQPIPQKAKREKAPHKPNRQPRASPK